MSDDLGSDIKFDTLAASEFHQENTHSAIDAQQHNSVSFTAGNDQLENVSGDSDTQWTIDDRHDKYVALTAEKSEPGNYQLENVSGNNSTLWKIDSPEARECLSLGKVQLTSNANDDEGTEELSFPPTEFSVELQKVGGVLAAPSEVADGNVSVQTNNDFSDPLHQITADQNIYLLDITEKVKSTEAEERSWFKKEDHIDDQNGTIAFETIKQNKETSNDIEFGNNFNYLWQSASPPSFRRWESDPAIERETDGTLKEEEQRFPIVYRLSLRYSKIFARKAEKIHVDSSFEKVGFLQKLSGRGFPYLNQWKRRYCVLTKGRLYLYEKESTNKPLDKCTSVIDLKYFDHVTEAMQKESKKVSNVFVVTSQDRSFFDPGRHLFAADTLTEMHDWIAKLRESIELIRNNNRPAKGLKTQQSKRDSQGLSTEDKQQYQQQQQKQTLGVSVHHQRTDLTVPSSDVVDARVPETQEEFKTKQEFTSSLKKKLKIESSDTKGDEEISEKDTLEDNRDKRTTSAGNFPSEKKISSTKISLQNPSLSLEAKPQLESITKHRIRGPQGRRAPQLRRTIIMKERASSMSALQQEGLTDNDARQAEDSEETGNSTVEVDYNALEAVPLNSSQPVLAYHYSSDEDSPSEAGCHGSDRQIRQSSSTGKKDKQKCSKISFNLDDEGRHRNAKKLMPKTHIPFISSKLPSAYPESVSEDFLDFRSLPRSLARESNQKKANVISQGLQVSSFSGSASSEGRLSLGRASPEMDALDNLLMNRSVQTNLSLNQEGCQSDQDGSETSTCKGAQEEHHGKKELLNEAEELKQVLGRFSSTMQHLQHHTAELENRTKQIEYEFKVSKNDIIHLQETTEVIRSEVKKLSDTVSSITQEALRAKKEYVLQRQETEKLQKEASETLSQAKNSQKEFERLKSEYDSSLKDLQSLITSIKSSFVITSEDRKPIQKMTLAEIGKSHSENNKAISCKEPKVDDNHDQRTSDDKKTNKDGTINQKGGYQSFFQRPTSLIYGFTSKSNKALNSSKKEKEDKSPSLSKDKEEKKKHKEEKQNLKNAERKNKQSKKHEHQTTCPVDSEAKAKPKEDEHVAKGDHHHHEKRTYPGFSIENLPMMDDHTDSLERKSDRTRSGSPYISQAVQNFGLEKSLSSPTVLAKFSNPKLTRPQELYIPITTNEAYKSTSNNSPDSPISPSITTLPFQSSCQISPREARIKPETLFPNQPSNLQDMSPQCPEDKLVNRHRQGVFAVTRQRSSPNIPIQRQSSGSMYPLQRQNSLGTVPEEGQLPRQASLMSVPENRPIVDQTLPLSPASSIASFGLSLSPSGDRLDNLRERYSGRNSMELVTGPVLSGSFFQESQARDLPPVSEFHINDFPLATSSIKKTSTKVIPTETLIL